MRIATASLAAVPDAIAAWRPDAIVSVLSPGHHAILPKWQGPRRLLAFQDLEGPRPQRHPTHLVTPAPITLPQREHVAAFLSYIDGYRNGLVLIHCRAGLGRSQALAVVGLVATGATPREACQMVRAPAPHASPNCLVLRHAEALMGVHLVATAEGQFSYARGPSRAEGEVHLWSECIPAPLAVLPRMCRARRFRARPLL